MAKTALQKKAPPADDVEFVRDVAQRSPEWYEHRRGLPTASRFATIMADGKDGGESVTRAKYMRILAGEIITGQVSEETYRNEAMERGNAIEPEARAYYERTRFVDLEQIGFVRRTVRVPIGTDYVVGASPDGAVVSSTPNGSLKRLLEIKSSRPDLIIEVAQRGAAGFPPAHRAQCQGNLWVTGYDEIELMLYCHEKMPAPSFVLDRDEPYIARIKAETERFVYELNQLVKRIREMAR